MKPAQLALAISVLTLPAGALLALRNPRTVHAATSRPASGASPAEPGRSVPASVAGPAWVIAERPNSRTELATEPIAFDAAPRRVPREADLEELIADLRDDDRRWNATSAVRSLIGRDRRDGWHAAVWHALEPHVDSADTQLRDLATGILIVIDVRGLCGEARPAPSPRLLDRVTEWLFREPRFESRFFGLAYPRDTVLFALDHVDLLEARLVDAVLRDDGDDPFRHAFVLGASGRSQHAHLVAPILVSHLRSNHGSDDACMATEALIGLGPAARPFLEVADADEQQRLSLEAILLETARPARTADEARARAHLNVISEKYDSAARSWRFRTSYKELDRSAGF